MRSASSNVTSMTAAPAQNSAACCSTRLEVEVDELRDTARSVDHSQEGNQHRQRTQHGPGARLRDIWAGARDDARLEPADELLRIGQTPCNREQYGHPDHLPRAAEGFQIAER